MKLLLYLGCKYVILTCYLLVVFRLRHQIRIHNSHAYDLLLLFGRVNEEFADNSFPEKNE